MVVKFPGRWKERSLEFSSAPSEQAIALSSAMAVLKGRNVIEIHFVEHTDGKARLIIELGRKR